LELAAGAAVGHELALVKVRQGGEGLLVGLPEGVRDQKVPVRARVVAAGPLRERAHPRGGLEVGREGLGGQRLLALLEEALEVAALLVGRAEGLEQSVARCGRGRGGGGSGRGG